MTKNEFRLLHFRNAFKGKRAFIIGNGPSLNLCDLSKLTQEYTFGVNSIFLNYDKMGFHPTFYVVEDVFVAEDRSEQINSYDGPTIKFFGNYLRYCLGHRPNIVWLNVIFDYRNYAGFPHFSEDATRKIYVGGTVSYLCMQLAYYMGFSEVYLIGFDHSYSVPLDAERQGNEILSQSDDPNHFHPNYFGKGFRWHDPRVDRMELAYKRAREVYERNGRVVKNATEGGKLEVFGRVKYDGLFTSPDTTWSKEGLTPIRAAQLEGFIHDPKTTKHEVCDVRITCVICTYRNPNLLKLAIESVVSQTLERDSYEVIVVDNNSSDETENVVQWFIQHGHRNVRYVFERRQGLSFARNRGVDEARAEIVAFIDDDAVADREWLSELLAVYDSDPDIWAVGGKIAGRWETERPAWLPDHMLRALSLIDWGPSVRPLAWPERIIGANCSFRRLVFREVGRFDEALGRKGKVLIGNEDTEIQQRIHALGKKIVYTPKALVFHWVPRERVEKRYFYRRAHGNGRSQALLMYLQAGNPALRAEARRRLRSVISASWKVFRVRGRENSEFGLLNAIYSGTGFLYQYARVSLGLDISKERRHTISTANGGRGINESDREGASQRALKFAAHEGRSKATLCRTATADPMPGKIKSMGNSRSSTTDADPVIHPALQRDLAEFVVVRMDKPPHGTNWHPPQKDRQGEHFCWSGADTKATLLIPVRRDRERLVVVAYHRSSLDEQLTGLRIEVDGVAIPHSIRAELNPKCIVARLPARGNSSGGVTELAFVLPRTVSPNSLSGDRADRTLIGLGVVSVSVIPAEPGLPIEFRTSGIDTIRQRLGLAKRNAASNFPLSHFDGLTYAEANPDVESAILDGRMPSAIEHYIQHGDKEGRRFALATGRAPNRGALEELLKWNFDGLAYLSGNPDVAEALRRQEIPSALYHYMAHGRGEGRKFKRAPQGQANSGTLYEMLEHKLQLELSSRTETAKEELARDFAAKQASVQTTLSALEKTINASVRADKLESLRKELQQGLSVAASKEDVARFSQEAKSLEAALREVQQGLSTAARREQLERLEQGAVRNLESIRNELATLSALRDAREQTLGAQIDALKSGLGHVQADVSLMARREDLERLEREATHNLERIQIAAVAAAREANEQILGLQADSLKAGVDSARARAELAETKVTSVQRELGAEMRRISESLSTLGNKFDTTRANTEKLQAELAAVKTQSASNHARINHPNLSIFNPLHYQSFPRTLSVANAERLSKHWAPLFGIDIQDKELYYLAHRVCSIEDLCQGRLATSIQDVLLRILVARGTKSKSLNVLEIGTLFGLGIIAIYEALGALFDRIHFTAIDPLDGYYGAERRDIVTGVPVTRSVFEENLRRAGLSREHVTLIQMLSTDPRALKRLGRKRYDLLIIDADHSYGGVKHDADNFISRVRAGGHVIFDDYGNPRWPDVKTCVDAEVQPRNDLELIGADWYTAAFRVRGAAIQPRS